MKILITGPSCSGKSTLGRRCAGRDLVSLDRWADVGDIAALFDAPGNVILEGIPSGSERAIRYLIDHVDLVLVLTVPLSLRLSRMIERDTPIGFGRFIYNEFAWITYCSRMCAASSNVLHVFSDDFGELQECSSNRRTCHYDLFGKQVML